MKCLALIVVLLPALTVAVPPGLELSAAATTPGAAVQGAALAQRVDAIFTPLDRPDRPGCVVAADRGDRSLVRAAYGMANLELGVELVPESVFYAGSVSKQFTAGAVALLALRGQVDLDEDIRSWFPELQYEVPITVRQLIHHTSGIRDYFELGALAGEPDRAYISNELSLELVSTQRALNFPPGDRYMYSNSGYMLLAELVGRVSGRSLREFAADEMLEPLGMARSGFEDDYQTIVPGRAGSYGQRADGIWFRYLKAFDGVGSGGLLTTAGDLLRWIRGLETGQLGADFLDLVLTRGTLNSGQQLGYAFGIDHGGYRGARTLGHSGALKGFRTALLWLADNAAAVAVLCNFAAAQPMLYAQRVVDAILEGELAPAADPATGDPAASGSELEPAFEPSGVELAEAAGIYVNEELGVSWTLRPAAAGLRLFIGSRDRGGAHDRGQLVALGPNRYRSFIGEISLERDPQGRVIALRLDGGRVRDVRFYRRR